MITVMRKRKYKLEIVHTNEPNVFTEDIERYVEYCLHKNECTMPQQKCTT